MSESESGYQELDLDNPSKASANDAENDIEIVDETPEAEPEPESKPAPVARQEDDDDEAEESSGDSSDRKRPTRSQRLKNQRDAYARQLAETQARLAEAEKRAQRFQGEANEGAAIGYDLYLKTIDSNIQALRRDFDKAFDEGDREKIFEVQQRMASLAAEKTQAERDRRSIPDRPAAPAGGEPQRPQQAPAPKKAPTPAAMEWYNRNKSWFNQDALLTAGARVIDNQMVQEGYAPSDPDYFEELDKRLKKEFPHKFGAEPAARPKAQNPTIQNRGSPPTGGGKIRVTISQADRDMARHLNIPIEDYAREKAKRERAQDTANQYTEI